MSNPVIDKNGTKRWFNSKGELHRLDGPAYEEPDGTKRWFKEGRRHRLDGPAVDRSDGFKFWWVDGQNVTEEEYPAAVLMYKCKQVLES
jgi:hypothetical protein